MFWCLRKSCTKRKSAFRIKIFLSISILVIFMLIVLFRNLKTTKNKNKAFSAIISNTRPKLDLNFNPNEIKTNKLVKQYDELLTKRKSWLRISDELFVYSAYIDARNFTVASDSSNSSPPPSSSPEVDKTVLKNEGIGASVPTQGQNIPKRVFNDDDRNVIDDDGVGDSDKLTGIILVRIVGIKAIPPLRDFIKKDILSWFRMKHEMDFSTKYECKLFFSLGNNALPFFLEEKLETLQSFNLTYTVIEEGVKNYAGTYFNCYFNLSSVPNFTTSLINKGLQVSIYPKSVPDYPMKLIDVNTVMLFAQSNECLENYKKQTLAVCVRPLFGPFTGLQKLIQFISYYHGMGITQFNFYLMSVSPTIRNFLSKLERKFGKEEANGSKQLPSFIINDWNLPTGNTSELWDYGTLAALNDCLFFNADQEFVIFVDIDEFIVPQTKWDDKNDNVDQNKSSNRNPLPTLWNVIDSYDKSKTFQFLVRNTFFCNEFCKLGQQSQPKPNLMNNSILFMSVNKKRELKTEVSPFPFNFLSPDNNMNNFLVSFPIFTCTVRTKRVWNVALRSKFIVNPRKVLSVGHHLVTKFVNKKVDVRFASEYSVHVDPGIAIMNHYRECGSISTKKHPILPRVKQNDQTMLKLMPTILNVSEIYLNL